MKKIIIDPHNCSREEYQELIDYLEAQCWDYSIEEPKPEPDIKYILGDNYINGIQIADVIFHEELFNYTIVNREEFIETLIDWISECNTSSKALMKADLQMLMDSEEEYIFSSISTNKYVQQGDSEFNDLCEELLELNKSHT
jgi:hypothetical protein